MMTQLTWRLFSISAASSSAVARVSLMPLLPFSSEAPCVHEMAPLEAFLVGSQHGLPTFILPASC